MKTFIKFVIISTLSLIIFFQNSFSNEKIKDWFNSTIEWYPFSTREIQLLNQLD